MCRRYSLVVVVLLVALLRARAATAHPLDLGYMRLELTDNQVAVQLELDRNAAALALGLDAAKVTEASVAQYAAALAASTYQRAPIINSSGECQWQAGVTATMSNRTVTIKSHAICGGGGAGTWRFPFVSERKITRQFQLMVKQGHGAAERLTLIEPSNAELELIDPAVAQARGSHIGFTSFVWSGVEHIGVAPNQWQTDGGGLRLPDGIDHILFLFALLLSGGTLLQLLGLTTGFTVGHSVTLALAALDVVRPPSSIIEPLIALSIALAALEAFFGKWQKHRWKIAMVFGLIHGFGLATALSHLELTTRGKVTALFGYNLGVELGQLVIVLLVAPVILIAQRRWRHGKLASKAAACVVFVFGMYWFIERLFAG